MTGNLYHESVHAAIDLLFSGTGISAKMLFYLKTKHAQRNQRGEDRAMKYMITLIFMVIVPAVMVFSENEPEKTASFSLDIPGEMILIPGGIFSMGIDRDDVMTLVEMGRKVPHMSESHAMWWFGDEIPKHTVRVESFFMDKYEVNNQQFMEFAAETGYKAEGAWRKHAKSGRLNHPVINVTWNDAKAYAEWAGKRLPSEEEWEYAARGGRDVKWFPWGDNPDPARANYRFRGETFFAGIVRLMGLRKMGTRPVGSYEPNGFGLYDMIGNVSEWCDDSFEPYTGRPEQTCESFDGKVLRGGSWESPNPVFIRLTNRYGASVDTSRTNIGFRCALSCTQTTDAITENGEIE
jgi:formylglycine-generating enzyme required for sulfatase activity